MSWVKVDDGFPDHPKTLVLSLAAQGLWLVGLCYANRLMTDGQVPAALLRRMGDQAAWPAAEELMAVGLWHETATGWEIHDYLQYQRSRTQIEAVSEARAEAGRRGGQANAKQTGSKTQANRQQTASNGEANPKQKRREEIREEEKRAGIGAIAHHTESVPAGFEVFWAAYPNRTEKKAAVAAWRSLNPDAGLQQVIVSAVEAQQRSRKWQEGFVKAPHRWLRDRNWEDEIPVEPIPIAAARGSSRRAESEAALDAFLAIANEGAT